jgi:uncharacterized protein YgiM (DUF1202 family)
MASIARLIALPTADADQFRFELRFPAPTEEDLPRSGQATLDLGDGKQIPLGELCGPTIHTWAAQHALPLGEYLYTQSPTTQAALAWDGETIPADFLTAETRAARNEPAPPVVNWLSSWTLDHQPLDVVVEIEVTQLTPNTSLRIDGGGGNLRAITPDSHRMDAQGAKIRGHKANWTFVYSKPGVYELVVDLLDGDGYWLARLAETPIEVAPPIDEPETAPRARAANPAPRMDDRPDAALAQTAAAPWLPFRYARPQWAWARTYTQAGGSVVSRSLVLGTYLAIRQEVTVGGALWYQTGSYDWIPASSVSILTTSDLRGVELDGATIPPPEPEPEPEPGAGNRGVVTANVLNVRSGPGVNHPIVDRLRYNMEVRIYDQTTVAGAVWYRIGANRWVHSGWVRIIDSGSNEPGPTRTGAVTADALNVRARPGVRADNPPIGRLLRGAQVIIYEEAVSDGATWYRIGVERWVHGGWIRIVAAANSLPEGFVSPFDQNTPSTPNALPVGWVVGTLLNVRAGPGTDHPIVGSVYYKQALAILETRVVGGVNWYRIGPDQWVYGPQVGVARLKARPTSIRANERWVGVNLKEQTVVAYEGDKPVYAALCASGLPRTPTVQGIFRTWWRVASRKMSGGSAATGGYYYLEEVTWTLYFYAGYALHAAYWHDAFGRPRSHGCVNLSPYDAWWIFRWSEPGGANSPAVYVYWE